VVFFSIRQLFTNVFALTGSWYLIALGTVAVVTMFVAPNGIWSFICSRLRIEWLSVKREIPYLSSN
jgi:branched-chain amino acid transport system permease protein